MGDLSEHFSEVELLCPCCGKLRLDDRLITALEKLRRLAKKPIYIESGYRCDNWNALKGGTPGSQHLIGRAADVVIPGMWPEEVENLAAQIWEFSHGGIGLYPHKGYTHLDVRLDGPARWKGLPG